MKTFEEINKIMLTIPEKWRYHWCKAEVCACLGCVQVGNRVVMYEKDTGKKFMGDPEYIAEQKITNTIYEKYKVTKEEWELWKKKEN